MDVDTFTALLTQKQNGGTSTSGVGTTKRRPNRLAVIDPGYLGIGNPHVTFEGESLLSVNTYACLEGYQPLPGDRVVMIPVGTTWVILNSVQNDISYPVITAGPLSYYEPYKDLLAIGQPGVGYHFNNLWTEYDGGFQFGKARYMVDAKGKVRIRGLIGSGTTGVQMFQLPLSLAPDFLLIFKLPSTAAGGGAEVRIDTTGSVYVQSYDRSGSNGYVALDEITYFPASRNIPWTLVAPANAWTLNNQPTSPPLRYYIDIDGIAHWSGLIGGGGLTAIANIPASAGSQTSNGEMFAACAYGGTARVDAYTTSLQILQYDSNGGANTYVSLEGIEYATPSCTSFMHNAGAGVYVSPWSAYGAGWNGMRMYKDSANIVRWSGLVKGGAANGFMNNFLPVGFRPAYQGIFNCFCGSAQGRIDILAASPSIQFVNFGTGGSTGFVSLNNMKYFAEA